MQGEPHVGATLAVNCSQNPISQPVVEQQEVVPDDEPLLEAIFPLPGGFSLPTVVGSPATLARLHLAPSSAAESLGTPLPVASSPCADVPDAASPLAGKRRGPESMSDAESSGTAEAPSTDSLAMVPLTPDDSHAPNLRRSSREHKKQFISYIFWVTGKRSTPCQLTLTKIPDKPKLCETPALSR